MLSNFAFVLLNRLTQIPPGREARMTVSDKNAATGKMPANDVV
jgi:hypothetical protein